MSTKPLIGISCSPRPKENMCFIRNTYTQGVEMVGGLPVMLPVSENTASAKELMSKLDGLILSGGHDVNPELYGEKPVHIWDELHPGRDAFELALLESAIELNKPVLAVCRGMQLLNVLKGGSLIQDIEDDGRYTIRHLDKDNLGGLTHEVTIESGSALGGITGAQKATVATVHHQAVNQVAPGFSVVAQAGDGMIEAIESPEYANVVALQWHPELTIAKDDPVSIRIFMWLIEAANKG